MGSPSEWEFLGGFGYGADRHWCSSTHSLAGLARASFRLKGLVVPLCCVHGSLQTLKMIASVSLVMVPMPPLPSAFTTEKRLSTSLLPVDPARFRTENRLSDSPESGTEEAVGKLFGSSGSVPYSASTTSGNPSPSVSAVEAGSTT